MYFQWNRLRQRMDYDDGVEVEQRNFGRGFAVRFFGCKGTY